ncbi:hypothetical protein N7526_003876 [Penicillium atrosanguineum]|nr:hypothetical protein N7526_003876 [Penicillium atrosanguineum]
MGWFWSDNKNDPVKNLEPGLREYLEQETPDKYVPANDAKKPSTPAQTPQPQEQADPSKSTVPVASLYQDGRYADLWKTYKPPTNLDGRSDARGAERVIEHHKERGDTVQRAAMENCALEHEALTYCFKTGNWRKQLESRLTMCAAENGIFSRCFTTQSEERIQMHADKLYHQMLDYEKRVDEAKAAGTEIPPVTSLFYPEKGPQRPSQEQIPEGSKAKVVIPGDEPVPEGFRPSKPLWQLTPHERELEIRSHNAQLEQQKLYFEEASPFVKAQEDTRTKRQEKAVSWFGETIGKWVS